MKKSLLTLLLLSATYVGLTAQVEPAAQWANLMGGANGDQSSAIAIDKEGNTLWLSTAASTEAAPEIYYGDEAIFNGALYTAGNSGNNNLALLCTAPDGTLKWVIYSNSGDYASGQGNIAVAENGDFVFTAKVRHTDGMLDTPINLIDATGTKYELGSTVDRRYNRLLVAKSNAAGEIQWTKLIEVSNAPAPAASGNNSDFTSDAVSSSALTLDNEGSIYIGGNYCAAMTIDGVTIEPTNVSSWTGDSQTSCGNMFVLKLDSDGKYLSSVVGEGDINGYSTVQALEWNDGYIYVSGYAKGTGTFSFANQAMTACEIISPIIGRMDTNLKADWLKYCPGSDISGKSALQNVGISVCADNLWMCGQYNLRITDATDATKYVEATQGSLREGFIISFDKNTGEWLSSADSRTDYPEITKLTGYLKALQSPTHLDKVYVYGYAMDANTGIFLREYDATTLTPNTESNWSLATGGGAPTAVAVAYDSVKGEAYITGRGNKAFELMGGESTPAPRSWDVLMAKFTLPATLVSGVTDLKTDESISSDVVYDLMGRRAGTIDSKVLLSPGIYICNNQKFIVR